MDVTSQFDHVYELYSGCSVLHAKIEDPKGMPCGHYHDDYELYFLVGGSRKCFLSNKIYTIQPNQIMLIEPKKSHQFTANLNIPYERYVMYITPKLLSAIKKENRSLNFEYGTQVFDLPEDAFLKIIHLLKEIAFETSRKDFYSADIIKSYIVKLFVLIKRHGNCRSKNTSTESDSRIQLSIDYILNNYSEPITLKKCAGISHMSPNYFSSIFSKVTGTSLKEFLNKTRIENACKLLEQTSYSIAEISQNVGFSTESYFGYVFKSLTGVSPTDYRRKCIKNNTQPN